jgi:hypothetical protein
LAAPPEPGELRTQLAELAGKQWRHPITGASTRFGASTIERWYYRALKAPKNPVGVLARKIRQDCGTHPSLRACWRDALLAQYQQHRSWSYRLQADNLMALARTKTDMGPAAAEAIVADVRERLRARVVDPEVVLDSIRTQLLARLKPAEAGIATAVGGPTVILVTGVNGSGKTTSIAKLAQLFLRDGKRVVLGAGDTFRAAAVEQLAMWAGRLGAEIVRGEPGCDPASVAHRAVAFLQFPQQAYTFRRGGHRGVDQQPTGF